MIAQFPVRGLSDVRIVRTDPAQDHLRGALRYELVRLGMAGQRVSLSSLSPLQLADLYAGIGRELVRLARELVAVADNVEGVVTAAALIESAWPTDFTPPPAAERPPDGT